MAKGLGSGVFCDRCGIEVPATEGILGHELAVGVASCIRKGDFLCLPCYAAWREEIGDPMLENAAGATPAERSRAPLRSLLIAGSVASGIRPQTWADEMSIAEREA